jgi:DNA-binding GntR family transcriptional regulator
MMGADLSLPRIKTYKISEAAYEILREKIISREFAGGQRLDLDAVETQLGISRTPLKEALARLEMEGLIVIHPRSGTYVTNPNPEDIAESFEVRRVLEVYALELAAGRASREDIRRLRQLVQELGVLAAATDRDAIYPRYLSLDHQFHQELVSLAGNRRLRQAHQRENLHAQMARIRYRRSERELNIAQEEHERIMAALEAGDVRTAQAEMDAHLRRAQQSLLADMGADVTGLPHPPRLTDENAQQSNTRRGDL